MNSLEDRAREEWKRKKAKRIPQEITDSDLANGKRLAKRHGQDIRYTPERGWMVWAGGQWVADERGTRVQALAKETAESIFAEIHNAADLLERDEIYKHARSSQRKTAIDAMQWLARSEPDIPAKLTDFDRDPFLFNVKNGTLDLRTGELQEHRRENLITNLADVVFDREATAELWDGFLWRVIDQNEELYGYLKRFVGYLLAGDTSEQVVHFLYGLGANGKTVFCEIIRRLLGTYSVVASPDIIMARKYSGIPNDIARLRGMRAVLMNETSQGARFDEAKLKDLTGGDSLTARFLHQEFFDFTPTHRLIIRGNHKPAITGQDDGIWRRLRLVPFTVSIPPDEQDKHLLQKLTAELSGILNWAIEGCLEWQREGLKPPEIITEAVRAYREESDVLGRFIAEHCEVRKLAQVKAGIFFSAYQSYCERASEKWVPSRDLPGEMLRRGFTRKRIGAGVVYEGLELHASDYQP